MQNSRLSHVSNLTGLISSFIHPKKDYLLAPKKDFEQFRPAVVIPTYRPTSLTLRLIKSLIKYHPTISVVVVDDCTPQTPKNLKNLESLKQIARECRQVTYLRTPTNALKAGALNFGVDYLLKAKTKPRVIFTFDDDVKINKYTLPNMVEELYQGPKIGAVCSLAIAKNKNKNILTRLQAVEYHSFNVSKIADNYFLKGPLVMQGMLTAFRTVALKQVKGYAQGHLIEDYDITVRLKNAGWKVRLAKKAMAWTDVPENIESLWKQRVRWGYGGLQVVADFWRQPVLILQDLIGHLMFLTLLTLIILSLNLPREGMQNMSVIAMLIALAILNFVIGFSFNLLILFSLPKRDFRDVILKLSLIPELIYCNLLSLVLMGAYIYFVYNLGANYLTNKFSRLNSVHNLGLNLFQKIGYSSTWGTRIA